VPSASRLARLAARDAPARAGKRRRRDRPGLDREAWSVELATAVSAELRAGRAPVDALAAGAAVVPDWLASAALSAVREARLGAELDRALTASADPLLRQLGVCARVSRRTGAPLAEVVDALVAQLRAKLALRREVAVALAGPRASCALLAGLPVVGLWLAAVLGASPQRVLLHTAPGGACLAGGVLFESVGLVWMRALVRRALPDDAA
jgi:tight adherence protein B